MNTLKKEIILSTMCMATDSNNNLVCVTPSGMIVGTPVESTNILNENDDMANWFSALNTRIENSLSSSNELNTANDGVILLKDVTIKSGIASYSLPYLNLFFDQIIGISLGNIN